MLSSYPATGFLMSVLQSHEATKDWLYNSYIQLFSCSDCDIDFFDICIENCPFIDYNIIKKDIILAEVSLVRFIMDMINEGYYLNFFVYTKAIAAYDIK